MLPVDCWGLILAMCPVKHLLKCRQVNRFFRDFVVKIINQHRFKVQLKMTQAADHQDKLNQLAALYRCLHLADYYGPMGKTMMRSDKWSTYPQLAQVQEVTFSHQNEVEINYAAFSRATTMEFCGARLEAMQLLPLTQLQCLKIQGRCHVSLFALTQLEILHLKGEGARLQDVGRLTRLRELALYQVPPHSLTGLRSLVHLHTLRLDHQPLTNAWVHQLALFPNLISYSHQTNCYDIQPDDVSVIGFPTQLQSLCLYLKNLSLESLNHITQLPCLHELRLGLDRFPSPVFPAVSSPHLRHVTIKQSYDTWTDISALHSLPDLVLQTKKPPVSLLRPLTALQRLELNYCSCSGLDLTGLDQLRHLVLTRTWILEASLLALPRLQRIDFNYDPEKYQVEVCKYYIPLKALDIILIQNGTAI